MRQTTYDDLTQFVQTAPMVDTHEHILREKDYLEQSPDVLQDLFCNYIQADLIAAGMPFEQYQQAVDRNNPDVEKRFQMIQPYWDRCQYTGYGEAVRIVARTFFEMDQVDLPSVLAAHSQFSQRDRAGERLRLLRDVANIDHAHVDACRLDCLVDSEAPEFFMYELSLLPTSQGQIDFPQLLEETGVTVTNLKTLDEALSGLFAKYAPTAISAKSQHAYQRTLEWFQPDPAVVDRTVNKLANQQEITEQEALSLGNWALDRGAALCGEHNLPLKIHTGYLAGNNFMLLDRIRPAHLSPLFIKHPQTNFDLFHIGYGFQDEIPPLAKHFSNVYADMCWAWTIDPVVSMNFLRSMIHTAPINKVFAFGGDMFLPHPSVGNAIQARTWLNRTLQSEVEDCLISEKEALDIARRIMKDNQYELFRVEEKQANCRDAAAA